MSFGKKKYTELDRFHAVAAWFLAGIAFGFCGGFIASPRVLFPPSKQRPPVEIIITPKRKSNIKIPNLIEARRHGQEARRRAAESVEDSSAD